MGAERNRPPLIQMRELARNVAPVLEGRAMRPITGIIAFSSASALPSGLSPKEAIKREYRLSRTIITLSVISSWRCDN